MVKAHNHYGDFGGASNPFRAEAEIEDMEIEGTIPKELDGTYYRVMLDPYYDRDFYLGGTKSIPFDGDGSVSAFRIRNGKVSYKQRYVLTERLVAERKAGKALFGMLRSPFSHHPCVRSVIDNVANTNVVVHAGKLLALAEQGPPYELEPSSLRTVGHEPFPGEISPNFPFTAHPHVDPVSGELLAFGYALHGLLSPDVSVYSIDKNGKKTLQRDFKFTGTLGIMHDCAITKHYVVIMMMPFRVDFTDIEKEGNHQWYYDEKMPTWFAVVPRDEENSIRWFKYKNCMPIHSGASWEEGGKIYFDASVASHNAFSFLPCKSGDKRIPNPDPADITVNYVKFCIDPYADSNEMPPAEVLLKVPAEFPRIDERFLTQKTRYTFLDCLKPDSAAGEILYHGLNAIARHDYATGDTDFCIPGEHCLVQEPAFSPRTPDAPEGDGFVITMIDNIKAGRNELIIQDTRNFEEIVARIILPFRLRSAVHGNWVDAERLEANENFLEPMPSIYAFPPPERFTASAFRPHSNDA
ncbi:putative cartenoid oxygenase [Paraphoma chrysanthemicola]|uniref:Cartenoid oxygenase n=1 Tax=Paraphoma chrysanthemicola TaxID=798071 RepID=A0A8K0QTH6_9PLEO|nr:putative cartenoid oxygenase [Paraphoma chrysanthemicola]